MRRFLAPLLLAAAALPGCGRLDDVASLTSPVVAQGLFVGLDLPDGVDITGSDLLQYSAACTVLLADVGDPSQLEQAPVSGADVQFRTPSGGPYPLDDMGEGKYLVTAASGLSYDSGDSVVVTTSIDGETAKMSVETPGAPDVDIPTRLKPEEGFTVDISGQGYDNVLVAVYDLTRNKLTYDNLPDDVSATYTYTHDDSAEVLDVPGAEAFLRQGDYVVGIAGMRSADPTTFEGVSQTLSAFMAGQFTLGFVAVEN